MTPSVCALHLMVLAAAPASLARTWAFPKCWWRLPPRLLEILTMAQCPLSLDTCHQHCLYPIIDHEAVGLIHHVCSLFYSWKCLSYALQPPSTHTHWRPSIRPTSIYIHSMASFHPAIVFPIFLASSISSCPFFPSYLLRLSFPCQLGFAWGGQVFVSDLK